MQRADMRLGRAGDHRSRLGCGGKERRRFAAHHLQVDGLVGVQILRCRQLQHLTLGNCRRSVREDVQHAQAAGLDHQLKAAGKEVVANQNRRLVVPEQVGRRPPAPLCAFIDHIVV